MSTTTLWSVTILNPDGSVHGTPTGGQVSLNAPGLNQSVTIPNQAYTCGNNHTLTGMQTAVNAMGGTGVNPWPDPHLTDEKSVGAGTAPSWDASGGQP